MSEKTHHLYITPDDGSGNDGIGRYFLIPGSPGRAELIAGMLKKVSKEIITPRHNDTYLGIIDSGDGREIDIGISSSGMGVGSMEIIATELIECGARRLLRVGTSGAILDPPLNAGDFVIATGAVRDELASSHYMPREYPSLAHPDMVLALKKAALEMGLEERTYAGIIHSKASLYARAKMDGPLRDEHKLYKQIMKEGNVLSSEMEASLLFVLSQCRSKKIYSIADEQRKAPDIIKSGTILGIIGTDTGWTEPDEQKDIERQTCELSIEGMRQLFILENPK